MRGCMLFFTCWILSLIFCSNAVNLLITKYLLFAIYWLKDWERECMHWFILTMTIQFIPTRQSFDYLGFSHCPTSSHISVRFLFPRDRYFFRLYLIPTVSVIFSRYEYCYLKMTYKYYIHNPAIYLRHASSPSMLPPVLSVWDYLWM